MNAAVPILVAISLGLAAGWLTAPGGDALPPAAQSHTPGDSVPSGLAVATGRPHSGTTAELFAAPLGSPADCRAMLAKLDSLAGGEHPLLISALRDRVLRRWLELDAEGALGFAEAGVKGRYEPGVAADLFRVWLDLDIDSALDSFAQASPALVAAVQIQFFSQLAQRGPQRALDELQKGRWAGQRLEGRVFSVWATDDPRAAAVAAQEWAKGEDTDDPNRYFEDPGYRIAAIWAESDPLAAWEFYRDGSLWRNIKTTLASYMLERDPNADLGEVSDRVSGRIGRGWAKRDIESALAFADANPDRVISKQLLKHVARELSNSEPERALAMLEKAEVGEVNYEIRGILRSAFAALSHLDHEASLRRMEALPANQRGLALSGILNQAHAADPGATPALLQKLLASPETGDAVLTAMKIAFSWGHGGGAQDLGEIVAAVPEFRDHVKEELLGGWIQTDPEEAAEFIAGRLAEDPRAFRRERHEIAKLGYSRPEFTGEWLQTLPVGQFRTNAAAALAANWSRFDPIGAAAWAETLAPGLMRDKAMDAIGK